MRLHFFNAVLFIFVSFICIQANSQEDVIDAYVDAIVEYQAGDNSRGIAENLIGEPGAGQPEESGQFAMAGGYAIVDMGLGEEIENGPRFDFFIYEGGNNEQYQVFASNNLDGEWVDLGVVTGHESFDLSDYGIETIRYLRIEDMGSTSDGADIDYVEVFYYPNDPWVDEVVEYNLNPDWADRIGEDEQNPLNAVGPDDDIFVSLPFSSIILRFTDNTVIDGEGDDLFIKEFGGGGESAIVSISADGQQWTELGIADNNTTTSYDLASVNFTQAVEYVRLEGLDAGGGSPGFDLDSVFALPNSIGAPPDPDNNPGDDFFEIIDPEFSIDEIVEFNLLQPMYPDGFKPLFTEEGEIFIAVANDLTADSPFVSVVRQQKGGIFSPVLNIVNGSPSLQIVNMWASRTDQIALLVGPSREAMTMNTPFWLVRVKGPFAFSDISNFFIH